jgi:predicted GNAT family acetyltransferase
MDLNVEHNENVHKYSARIGGDEAVVTYLEEGETVVFTHTVVPEAQRGRGVGEELVRQALEDSRRRGRKVAASCPFVLHYLERHPEYQDSEEES